MFGRIATSSTQSPARSWRSICGCLSFFWVSNFKYVVHQKEEEKEEEKRREGEEVEENDLIIY